MMRFPYRIVLLEVELGFIYWLYGVCFDAFGFALPSLWNARETRVA